VITAPTTWWGETVPGISTHGVALSSVAILQCFGGMLVCVVLYVVDCEDLMRRKLCCRAKGEGRVGRERRPSFL
jgi:hypothetical protein